MRRCLLSLLLAAVLFAPSAPAPAEGYLDGDGIAAAMTGSIEIGKSLEGRPIRLERVTLGDAALETRPTLLIVAGLAPDHRIGQTVAARLGAALRTAAESDALLAATLERCAVEIIPLVNPDGLAALSKGPGRARRTNARKVDTDRDGSTATA